MIRALFDDRQRQQLLARRTGLDLRVPRTYGAAWYSKNGHADLVALGRGALANPDWSQRVADGRHIEEFDGTMLKPDVTLDTQAAWLQLGSQ